MDVVTFFFFGAFLYGVRCVAVPPAFFRIPPSFVCFRRRVGGGGGGGGDGDGDGDGWWLWLWFVCAGTSGVRAGGGGGIGRSSVGRRFRSAVNGLSYYFRTLKLKLTLAFDEHTSVDFYFFYFYFL